MMWVLCYALLLMGVGLRDDLIRIYLTPGIRYTVPMRVWLRRWGLCCAMAAVPVVNMALVILVFATAGRFARREADRMRQWLRDAAGIVGAADKVVERDVEKVG